MVLTATILSMPGSMQGMPSASLHIVIILPLPGTTAQMDSGSHRRTPSHYGSERTQSEQYASPLPTIHYPRWRHWPPGVYREAWQLSI